MPSGRADKEYAALLLQPSVQANRTLRIIDEQLVNLDYNNLYYGLVSSQLISYEQLSVELHA